MRTAQLPTSVDARTELKIPRDSFNANRLGLARSKDLKQWMVPPIE